MVETIHELTDRRGAWLETTELVGKLNRTLRGQRQACFAGRRRVHPPEGEPQEVEGNTMENAAISGLEVSQNSFARVIKNSIRQNRSNGILVLGSASVHIGVMQTGDKVAQPNVIENNGGDGITVMRSSTARIIGIQSAVIDAMA